KSVLWGIPRASAPHAPHLEFGFRPHWVPARHVGLWMQRHGVGVSRRVRTLTVGAGGKRVTSRKAYKTVRSVAMGLFVGGPGSTLQTAPGGTSAHFFMGPGRRQYVRYYTSGGVSEHLARHTVGHPILRPVAAKAHTVPLTVYARGFARG